MKTAGRIATILLIASGVLYFILAESDEEQITRRLNELVEALTIEPNTESGTAHLLSSAGKAAKAASYTSETSSIRLAVSLPLIKSQSELTQILAQIIHNTDSSSVEIHNLNVSVNDHGAAIVLFEAKASGTRASREYTVHNKYETTWTEVDGDWLIETVKITETIREG